MGDLAKKQSQKFINAAFCANKNDFFILRHIVFLSQNVKIVNKRRIIMGNIGFQELLVILLIILLLFGAKKLPELAKGLGSGLREFKKAAKEIDIESSINQNAAESGKPNDK